MVLRSPITMLPNFKLLLSSWYENIIKKRRKAIDPDSPALDHIGTAIFCMVTIDHFVIYNRVVQHICKIDHHSACSHLSNDRIHQMEI